MARFLLNIYKKICYHRLKNRGGNIMKRFTFIITLCLLVPLVGMSQNKAALIDDIYFKPSDAKNTEIISKSKQTPNYKNGAKEIIYIERESNKPIIIRDTVYVLAQANDSTEYYEEEGEYLNEFKGSQSDLEYAERIRRFHNPKYTIHISDPGYTDIYFLDSYDWNVYVDGSYAWVTPTWTNPYWWNYNYSPYSYSSWYWRNSIYSPYSSWYYNPWNNFYGGYYGYGYGGYYGYGSYYGYGGYYGYPYYNDYWGGGYYSSSKPKHNEADRRGVSNYSGTGSRMGGTAQSAPSSVTNSGYNASSSRNPYTTVTGTGTRSGSSNPAVSGTRTGSSSVNSSTRPIPNNGNGIGAVRRDGISRPNTASQYRGTVNTPTRTPESIINTRPRTTNENVTTPTRSSNSTPTRSYDATPSRGSYSTGSPSVRTSTGTYNSSTTTAPSSTRSSSSYSSGSSSSPSSSYSGGSSSSSSGSRSSSSSSGGSRR